MKAHVCAISFSDFRANGCPGCGDSTGIAQMSEEGTAFFSCPDRSCRSRYAVLAPGVTKSRMAFGTRFPEVTDHPRRSTAPKNRDATNEERFRCFKPAGLLVGPGCFVCSGPVGTYHMGMAIPFDWDAAWRIVEMFGYGAWPHYRLITSLALSIAVGTCAEHVRNLRELAELVSDGHITTERIRIARTF